MKGMLSIVIPSYNEEARLPKTLEAIISYLGDRPFEIIVVDDGSNDGTAYVVKNFGDSRIRLISNLGNKGKGFSVRRGMLQAKGDIILFSDADLATPISELDQMLLSLHGGFSVVIGSRALKDSNVVVHQPFYREFMGKLFNKIVRVATISGIKDTQCGFKLFTKEASQQIFSNQQIDGFGFDVEVLFLARKFSLKIKEVPVTWINDSNTKVHVLHDSWRMLLDVIKIRWIHAQRNIPKNNSKV